MKYKLLLTVCTILLAMVSAPAAQDYSITLDHVDGLYPGDPTKVETDVPITFYLRLTNAPAPNEANIVGASNGFRVYSPDGATWSPITQVPYWDLEDCFCVVVLYEGWDAPPNFNDNIFINPYSVTGEGADTIGLGGNSKFPSPGVLPGFSEVVYSISTMVNDAQHGKTICLDSCWYPPGNEWLWSTDTGFFGDLIPNWDGPHCFQIKDPDFVAPSNLVISADTLEFEAIFGGGNPPFQSFDIGTDNDPLAFTLSESGSWLSLSAGSGSTPMTVNVFVGISGLSIGTYYETITIASGSAANSPQEVVVKLNLIAPPPEIGLSTNLIQFFAVADGANPDPKLFSVSNTGGSTLNWTASNSEAWLSIDPTFGTDAGDVTLNVDITGLIFGDYFDTVWVSDPAAANDPQFVEVRLTVGSNLPVIEVDSAFNYIIVPGGSTTIPTRKILIRNGGIGELDFVLSDSANRIQTYTPTSGSAPQEVEVGFKINNGTNGFDYFDTIWVYSDQAVNSPFPVVFQFHYVENPAFLMVDKDTIKFTMYNCSQGATGSLPGESFYVYNNGGDDPVDLTLLYDSPLFKSQFSVQTAPANFLLRGLNNTEPPGVYYDTVLISAINAINSPETLIVKTTMIEKQGVPTLLFDSTSWTFVMKLGSTPPSQFPFRILNQYGGCMDWSITENVPWLYFTQVEGEVPEMPYVTMDPAGYAFGSYHDEFTVESQVAGNSPQLFDVHLHLWKFRGDCNFNGARNISDLTYLVDYLFGIPGGPEPIPIAKVCDLNCDGSINISDLTYLIAWYFQNGPEPCNDP